MFTENDFPAVFQRRLRLLKGIRLITVLENDFKLDIKFFIAFGVFISRSHRVLGASFFLSGGLRLFLFFSTLSAVDKLHTVC